MSNDADRDKASRAAEEPSTEISETGSPLPRTLQEHLAQKLRSAYHELAEKPAFLGDPAVPAEFEYHLQRLEAVEKVRHTEKVHNQAIEAVKAALETIAGPFEPGASEPGQGPDEK
jgi:hypothetical protein